MEMRGLAKPHAAAEASGSTNRDVWRRGNPLWLLTTVGLGAILVGTVLYFMSGSPPPSAQSAAAGGCPAPMDPLVASLAGSRPLWLTWQDRGVLGPELTTRTSSDYQMLSVVATEEVPWVEISIQRREDSVPVLLERPDLGAQRVMTLTNNAFAVHRGPTWLQQFSVKFERSGCYEARLRSANEERSITIRVDEAR